MIRTVTAVAILLAIGIGATVMTGSGTSSPEETPNRFVTTPTLSSCGFGYNYVNRGTPKGCVLRTFRVQVGKGNTLSEIAERFGDAGRWNELCVTRFEGPVKVTSFVAAGFDPQKLLPGSTVAVCP